MTFRLKCRVTGKLAWVTLLASLAMGPVGCEQGSRATSAPSTAKSVESSQPPQTSSGDGTAAPQSPPATRVEPPRPPAPPKRPKDSWVVFRTAFDDAADAAIESKWTGANRIEVLTHNVSRVTLDLTKLPDGAPQKGPWNLQIDEQGIQITGARGKVLDLIRSKGGVWKVDKK